jgi:hypothetical protein
MQSHEICHHFVTITLAVGVGASTFNTDLCAESRTPEGRNRQIVGPAKCA